MSHHVERENVACERANTANEFWFLSRILIQMHSCVASCRVTSHVNVFSFARENARITQAQKNNEENSRTKRKMESDIDRSPV